MVKLFSKNSNLCDHNSPTLQTDRQTDKQTDGQTDDIKQVAHDLKMDDIGLLILIRYNFVCVVQLRSVLFADTSKTGDVL